MSRHRHSGREKEHGFYWGILTALYNGPKSEEELKKYFTALGRRLGFFWKCTWPGKIGQKNLTRPSQNPWKNSHPTE